MITNQTTETTAAQDLTIATEVAVFTRRNGVAPATLEIYPSAYSDEVPGAVGYTMHHPGTEADGSGWSMDSSTLLPGGAHWDTDPVKPWELA